MFCLHGSNFSAVSAASHSVQLGTLELSLSDVAESVADALSITMNTHTVVCNVVLKRSVDARYKQCIKGKARYLGFF